MNEIERAIAEFIALRECFSARELKGHVDMAIEALREKQERENWCEWCQEPPSEWKLGDKIVGFTTQYYEYGDDASHYVRNKFCPMCGKRLEGKP
jgi:hypothetical protein